jgi:hypothetical protein
LISVIVSSYKPEDFLTFSLSLAETIGVPFELIRIDNPNKYSLSEAYNQGAEQAKFEILVFVHEDVTFVTECWGQILAGLFNSNPEIGIIGVAGSLKKSFLPTGWGTGLGEFDRIYLIQAVVGKEDLHSTCRAGETYEEVKVLDGVMMATPKAVWSSVRFDEELEGYHVYDIDFSLRVTKSWKGLLSYEILLKHFSMGTYDSDWVQKTLEYHQKVGKSSLFEKEITYASKSRRAWYKALTPCAISTQGRSAYLKLMGVDLFSSLHAFSFRFPWVGNKIFKLLNFIGL